MPNAAFRVPGARLDELLALVDRHFGDPRPDRRGERWVPCPMHGERGHNSFSYSERGYNCFACEAQGGLHDLAERLGLVEATRAWLPPVRIERPAPAPAPERPWQHDPRVLERFQPIPPAALRYYRGRGFSDESIARWRLGYGVLPSSRCLFPRFILPVFEGGRLVDLRGRIDDAADNCPSCDWLERGECSPKRGKWLHAGGGDTVLFARDCLGEYARRPGATVIVAEAPYSAILAMQRRPELCAVAPTVSSVWKEEWTAAIAAARPGVVIVFYDCDEHGETYGLRVAQALAKAHLPVHRWRWPKGSLVKADLADVVTAGGAVA